MKEIYYDENKPQTSEFKPQIPEFMMKKQKETEKINITEARKFEEEKTYKPTKTNMAKKIKKLILIAIASVSLGVGASKGISIYNNQQITRQAKSYDDQINDYNHELYDKIQNLKEEGLKDMSNDELRSLIGEVNWNNYNAIKDKVAKVIPDYSGGLKLEREDHSNFNEYKIKYDGDSVLEEEFKLNNRTIQDKLDRYISMCNLIDKTENGDVDRTLLEKELFKSADEMKKIANMGIYVNTEDGNMKDNALKTYSISKNKDKIEEKLSERDVADVKEKVAEMDNIDTERDY